MSPSLHEGDFELSKLQICELRLSDMIETRSGSRQPPAGICILFVDAAEVNARDVPQGRVAGVRPFRQ